MLLRSLDSRYIRDDLTIQTKPDHSILLVRLTWKLTSCTSQSRTRRLSESSPSSSTCSQSGANAGLSPLPFCLNLSIVSTKKDSLKYLMSYIEAVLEVVICLTLIESLQPRCHTSLPILRFPVEEPPHSSGSTEGKGYYDAEDEFDADIKSIA